MPPLQETSTRLLVDRTVVRVDGRPFFSFGPRLLLTPPHRYDEACARIAEAGFTTVGSPPASPGTIPQLEALFDAAERHRLMVVLMGDPALPKHGRYLAEHFRHRPALHSYCLPWIEGLPDPMEAYSAWRDELRTADLFHPIWSPLGRARPSEAWLRSMDIHAAPQPPQSVLNDQRLPAAERLAEVSRLCNAPIQPRPLLCSSLPVLTSDTDRALGLYADDPTVAAGSPVSAHWFPGYTAFDEIQRRDWLGPDPAALRLQFYELISVGVRGVLLDFHEAMLGSLPCSGRDRLAEASLLAQECALLYEFLAEGRPELCLVEPGHPKLSASVIRHGPEYLILVRANREELGPVDEAYFARTEVDIRLDRPEGYRAWRLDFPMAQPVEITRDAVGSLRLSIGAVDMTAAVMLTTGVQRARELSEAILDRLPRATANAIDCLRTQLMKVLTIEGELTAKGHGVRIEERLLAAGTALSEAEGMVSVGETAAAYLKARDGLRELRALVRIQMARAKAEPILRAGSRRDLLRRCYYTLPGFYHEKERESAGAYHDFT